VTGFGFARDAFRSEDGCWRPLSPCAAPSPRPTPAAWTTGRLTGLGVAGALITDAGARL